MSFLPHAMMVMYCTINHVFLLTLGFNLNNDKRFNFCIFKLLQKKSGAASVVGCLYSTEVCHNVQREHVFTEFLIRIRKRNSVSVSVSTILNLILIKLRIVETEKEFRKTKVKTFNLDQEKEFLKSRSRS